MVSALPAAAPSWQDTGGTTPRPTRRRVELHGVTAEISAPDEPFAALLGLPFGGYPTADWSGSPNIRVEVLADEETGGWIVTNGDLRMFGSRSPAAAARRAEWIVADNALRRLRHFIHVHAAVVASDRQSVLLVGPSGRGKSTTSVGLAQFGLSLYTDDVALIRSGDFRPLAFPRPIKLDAASRALLGTIGLRVPQRQRLGESVARSALPGAPTVDEPGPPIGCAVFLSHERRHEPGLRPLSAAEALLRLLQQSSTERITPTGPPAGALALINAVRCYELVLGDYRRSLQMLLDLANTGGDPGSCP